MRNLGWHDVSTSFLLQDSKGMSFTYCSFWWVFSPLLRYEKLLVSEQIKQDFIISTGIISVWVSFLNSDVEDVGSYRVSSIDVVNAPATGGFSLAESRFLYLKVPDSCRDYRVYLSVFIPNYDTDEYDFRWLEFRSSWTDCVQWLHGKDTHFSERSKLWRWLKMDND